MSHILVHPVTGRVLLQPGDIMADGSKVEGIGRDGLGQTVVYVSGGQRMSPQPNPRGRRFDLG